MPVNCNVEIICNTEKETNRLAELHKIIEHYKVTPSYTVYGEETQSHKYFSKYRQKLNVIEFPTKEGPRIGGASGAKAFPTTLAMIRVLLTERHRKK